MLTQADCQVIEGQTATDEAEFPSMREPGIGKDIMGGR